MLSTPTTCMKFFGRVASTPAVRVALSALSEICSAPQVRFHEVRRKVRVGIHLDVGITLRLEVGPAAGESRGVEGLRQTDFQEVAPCGACREAVRGDQWNSECPNKGSEGRAITFTIGREKAGCLSGDADDWRCPVCVQSQIYTLRAESHLLVI